jgi:tape measure domain-containing protein
VSATIETRITELKFDNSQFEAGVRQSLATIQHLNQGLKLDGAAKGFQNLNAAAKATDVSHIARGVDAIASKFNALSVIAVTALANITNRAITAGTQIAKSLTLDPIKQGFEEYETKLGSVQTILANTAAAGTKLSDVNAALKELNQYSDQTIYNFAEMAKNIGTFTAAGVDLQTATGSIKGIANLAALSGSNSQQASTAMYQLSQAISAGRVSLQDWNSVVNAGMGGTIFQRALAQTAEKMGTLDKGAVSLTGKMKNVSIEGKSFRESITAKPGEESWLTSEVLTATLQQFTGDLSDAELAAQGFSAAQIKAIQAQAKTAKAAATEVKTATQLMGTLKEASASGWAETFEIIVGDFEEAKALWTSVNDVFGGFIQASADGRNKLLADWKEMGGRTHLIEGIKAAFEGVMSVVKPIKDAFRQIFPATSAKQLLDITIAFREFAERLKIGGETADKLKRTFAGVFAIFGIGWEIIKQVARVFFELFGTVGEGTGSFLEITAKIGDFLVKLHEAVKNGEGLTNFFSNIASIIKIPIKLIGKLAGALGDLFGNLDFSFLDGIGNVFGPLTESGDAVDNAWSKVEETFQNIGAKLAPLAEKFVEFFQDIGTWIAEALGNVDWELALSAINTGLFAGLVLLFKQFTGSFGGIAGGITDALGNVTSPFSALTGTLETMQTTLRAATLLQIAAAVGILALSVVALSKVDADGLKRALTAMSVMFLQLAVAMAVFQKIDIRGGMTQLILLSIAIKILTSAVKDLAELSWEELAKGLSATAALLILVAGAARAMPDGKKMISSSIGLVIMAGAIKLLASSVKDLAEMSWEEMARGLVGVGAMLAALALFTRFAAVNKGGLAQGAGLVLLAVGIKLLASALQDFSAFSWEEIGRGLAAMGGGLALMAAALKLIPPSSVLSAAAVLIVATSLGMLADSLQQMASMGWEEIAKGLVVLGGSLLIIAAAMNAMTTAIFGAAALLVVAAALRILTPVLQSMAGLSWEEIAKGLTLLAGALLIIAVAMNAMTTAIFGAAALVVVAGALAILAPVLLAFGAMSWESIAKGLIMLAGALAVIGIAAALLTPVIPSMLGMGIAIGLLGAAVALAGVGVLAFSVGLIALSGAAAMVVAGLTVLVTGVLGLLPVIVKALGDVIVALAQAIQKAAPAVVAAIVAVLVAFMDAIVRLTPRIGRAMIAMITMLLGVLQQAIPKMVRAGLNIVVGILNGVAANIGRVITAATNVIVAFLGGISRNLPRIIDSGVKLIIAFVNGMANAIRRNQAAMNAAGRNLASAIVEGMVSGITGGISAVTRAARNLAKSALSAAKSFLGISSPSKEFAKLGMWSAQGYAKGMAGGTAAITATTKTMQNMLLAAMAAEKRNIATLEARLRTLNAARVKNRAAILATTRALAEARAEYAKTSKAYQVSKTFGDEIAALNKLATRATGVSAKLAEAHKAVEEARQKTFTEYSRGVEDQYDNLPDISKDTKLTDYIKDLQKQVVNTQILTAQLQELKKLGLNDDMYQTLLGKGVDAIPFVTQILEGGKNAVTELNALGGALDRSAQNLGNSAAGSLYEAGIRAAQGLVVGLQQEQAAIQAEMNKIAASMAAQIKTALGIRSPSKVFQKIGDWSIRGLALGLRKNGMAVQAAEEVGHNAVEAMRKTLKDISSKVGAEVDVNPSIKPVLDLTDVQKQAGRIDGLLSAKPLEVGSAYSSATQAMSAIRASERAREVAAAEAAFMRNSDTPLVQLTQNNNSPKALSEAEIYRNGKSLISKAKGALETAQ